MASDLIAGRPKRNADIMKPPHSNFVVVSAARFMRNARDVQSGARPEIAIHAADDGDARAALNCSNKKRRKIVRHCRQQHRGGGLASP
ncbi:MAG: hypothetical protein ACTHLO_14605 [Pseudolabrys sp.]